MTKIDNHFFLGLYTKMITELLFHVLKNYVKAQNKSPDIFVSI